MKGASRTILPQPLAALARKTASGGKIRARRFAPAWSVDKPLYRFEKIRRRTQTRVGARILANTVGNLVAEKLSEGGKSGGSGRNGSAQGGNGTDSASAAAPGTTGASVQGASASGTDAGGTIQGEPIVVIGDPMLHRLLISPWLSNSDFQNRYLSHESGNLVQDTILAGSIIASNQNAYSASISRGYSISSGGVTFGGNWSQAIGSRWGSAQSQWNDGGLGYISGPVSGVLSPVSGTFDVLSSYKSGRGGWIAPADRQDTDTLMFVGGMAAGELGSLSRLRGISIAAESEISVGTKVTRNFGGNSGLYGESWTTDPITAQSRNSLGLETTNTGEFVVHGVITDASGITTREALPWGRFAGGGQETLIPDAANKVRITGVTMPDDPLPWTRVTDPRPLPSQPRRP